MSNIFKPWERTHSVTQCTTCCGNGWLIAYIDEHVFPERCEICNGLGEIEDSQYEEAMDLKYMERMGK